MLALGLFLSLLIGVSLGFFGGGGSILTVPLLIYVFGMDVKEAIASSLLVVAAASSSGMARHWAAGHVNLRIGLPFGIAAMAGAFVGGRASALIDERLLLLLFSAMMALTSFAMWHGRSRSEPREETHAARVQLALQGFVVGLFTGVVGAGGGFLIVPALVLWAGLPMATAVGTSLVIIVMKSLAGFSGYASHVQVDYAFVATISGLAIAGSFAGSRLMDRIDPASLRRGFAGFIGLMAGFVLVREGQVVLDALARSSPVSAADLAVALGLVGFGIALGRRVSRRALRTTSSAESHFGGAGI
jgi:uncharacterized membrane protein YfcA